MSETFSLAAIRGFKKIKTIPIPKLTARQVSNFFGNLKIENDCWLWLRYVNKKGYGSCMINKKAYKTHRVSYQIFFGKLTEGYTIDHLCQIKDCCNPFHLEEVLHAENNYRGNSPPSLNARKKNCPNCGKPYDKIRIANGLPIGRKCLPCQRLHAKNKAISAQEGGK